jgi:hypothetical protein
VRRREERAGRGRPRRQQAGRPAQQDNVERPRTDPSATSAEGREQPKIEPAVPTTDAPVAQAPDTTTPVTEHEQPQKLDQSGDPGREKSSGEGGGSRGGKKGRS